MINLTFSPFNHVVTWSIASKSSPSNTVLNSQSTILLWQKKTKIAVSKLQFFSTVLYFYRKYQTSKKLVVLSLSLKTLIRKNEWHTLSFSNDRFILLKSQIVRFFSLNIYKTVSKLSSKTKELNKLQAGWSSKC